MAIQKFLKLDQTEIDISNDIFFHIPVVFSKWNEYSMKIYFNSMITYFTENNIYITFLKHTVVINKTIIIINYIAYLWTNSMHSSICIALDLFDDRSYHNRININMSQVSQTNINKLEYIYTKQFYHQLCR